MIKKYIKALLAFAVAAVLVEGISYGFSLMNQTSTPIFYAGLLLVSVSFSIIGIALYKLTNSIINSIKNK